MPSHARPRTDARRRRERALAAARAHRTAAADPMRPGVEVDEPVSRLEPGAVVAVASRPAARSSAVETTVAPPRQPRERRGQAPRRHRPRRPRTIARAGADGVEVELMTAALLPAPGTVAALGAAHRSLLCPHVAGAVPRRRSMRPRQLAVVMAVAFTLALLLNATDLQRDAETSPYGLRRSLSLALLRPVAAVSHALALDRPRVALDQALGHDVTTATAGVAADSVPPPGSSIGALQTASPGGEVTGLRDRPPVPPATQLSTAAIAPARGAAAARFVTVTTGRVPSASAPLRVWVGGDSVAGYLGLGMVEKADRSGVMAAHSHYQVSTGLSRPDYYDWPAHLEEDMNRYDPEVVVFLVGANDDQPVTTAGGGVAEFGSAAWRQEYGRRVGAVMDRLQAEHRLVVWVGEPVERAADFDARMRLIDEVEQEQAAIRPGVIFLDTRPVFADPGGGFSAYLRDPGGRLTLMRAGDGVHLSPDGGRLLAGIVVDRVMAALRQDDQQVPVGLGAW